MVIQVPSKAGRKRNAREVAGVKRKCEGHALLLQLVELERKHILKLNVYLVH